MEESGFERFCIVNIVQQSYCRKDPGKVFTEDQAAKNTKYLGLCQESQKSFVPLVLLVGGVLVE